MTSQESHIFEKTAWYRLLKALFFTLFFITQVIGFFVVRALLY